MRRPGRIVDAHVHFWDPARTDWYPYLSGRQQLDLGDTSGMARRFDVSTYRAESAGWNVEAFVNVAAATGPHSVEETLELDRRAETDGHPDALIGGVVHSDSVAEAIGQIDRQMAAPRFRGVRPMGASPRPVPDPEVLRALADRDLLFELMTHPPQLRAAAEALAGFVGAGRGAGLTVVVEHAGWPRTDDPEEFTRWAEGMAALAGLGAEVHCKLSGLAMPLGTMRPEALAPWVEHAIETFGVDRCFFASNFPVDGLHGSLGELWTSYAEVVAGLDDASVDALFAGNAERLYRIGPAAG